MPTDFEIEAFSDPQDDRTCSRYDSVTPEFDEDCSADPLGDDREDEKIYRATFGRALTAQLNARCIEHLRTLNEIFYL